MTLEEAKQLAKDKLGVEVLTPEGMVSRVYNAICMNEDGIFRVYGDGVLLGESAISALIAWEDAVDTLPDFFCRNFHRVKNYYLLGDHYIKKEKHDGKENSRGQEKDDSPSSQGGHAHHQRSPT
jgi:hypothetical protein